MYIYTHTYIFDIVYIYTEICLILYIHIYLFNVRIYIYVYIFIYFIHLFVYLDSYWNKGDGFGGPINIPSFAQNGEEWGLSLQPNCSPGSWIPGFLTNSGEQPPKTINI